MGTGHAEKPKPYYGYRRVARAFPWVAIKHETAQKSTEIKGKILAVHADGTYRVRYQDGDIDENVAPSAILAKLAGSRDMARCATSSVYRKGDIIKCRHVSGGGRAQVAWHNPRTQEVRWNCPQPADRIFYEFISISAHS